MKIETRLVISAQEKKELLDYLDERFPICNRLGCKEMDCSNCPLNKLTDEYQEIRDAIRDVVFDARVEG